MSKNWEHLSIEKLIQFNREIIQITTEEILTLKQKYQIATITMLTGTQGVRTITKGIIRTSLTPKE